MKKFALVQFSSCRGDLEIDKVERFEAECLADTYEHFDVDLRSEAECVASTASEQPTWQELIRTHVEHVVMLGGEETFAFIIELQAGKVAELSELYDGGMSVTYTEFDSIELFDLKPTAVSDHVACVEQPDYTGCTWYVMPN